MVLLNRTESNTVFLLFSLAHLRFIKLRRSAGLCRTITYTKLKEKKFGFFILGLYVIWIPTKVLTH